MLNRVVKITKGVVDRLAPGQIVWDAEIKGFGVRRQKHAKSYFVKYRKFGKLRWYTIGRHGVPWTSDQARIEAKRILGIVVDTRESDPAVAKANDSKAETVSQLCDDYLRALEFGQILGRLGTPKKISTIYTDKGRIKRHIKPLLGNARVKDVTPADIRKFMRDVAVGKSASNTITGPHGRSIVSGGKGTASRTVGLLGGIFSFAVEQGLRSENPVRGIKRYPDTRDERRLTADELSRLGNSLSDAGNSGVNPYAIAAIELLILTGCRKSEILCLEWGAVDFEGRRIVLSDSKTGKKIVPLGTPALELLSRLPRISGSKYVLPSVKKIGSHLVGLQKIWERIRENAGLSKVRLHQFRHTFASVGAEISTSLPILGSILGHRDPKTTARYTHIGNDPALGAAENISNILAIQLNGGDENDPTQLSSGHNTLESKRSRKWTLTS